MAVRLSNYKEIERVLEIYPLEDLFEMNNLSTEDVLLFLVEEEFLELPDVKPL